MDYIRYNLKNTEEIIKKTITVLNRSGLVIFPSDTVYGLLVDATSESAVEKLIAFKNRPPGKPISVFLADFKMLEEETFSDDRQKHILNELLPGPFTIILNSKHKVIKKLESEKGTLGIRIPDYDLIRKLTAEFKKPITATSANISGKSPHYSIESLLKDLSQKKQELVDLIVDASQLPRNKPSTIVDLSSHEIKLLRKGDIIFDKSKVYISKVASQTEKIGEFLLGKHLSESKSKPLVFIIEGELGVGKTVLVKGMGKKLGIDNIISPTFVIYYEYGNFYHFDLYQIEEKNEFDYLGIEKMLKPGNIICFEWGERTGEIHNLLKNKAKIVYIKMKYINDKEREIVIKD